MDIYKYSIKRKKGNQGVKIQYNHGFDDDVEFHDYPTKSEAEEAWNTLIGFCVSQGLPGGTYSHEELCDKLKIYLNLL